MLRILTTAEQETLLEKYAELTRLRAAIFRAELEVTEARNKADTAANDLELCLGVGNKMFRYWVPDVNVDRLRSVGKPASRKGVSRKSRIEESGGSRIEESGGSRSVESERENDDDDEYSGTEKMEVIVTTISMGPALKVLRSRYAEKERVAAETASLAVEKGENLKKLRKQEQGIIEEIAAIENMTFPDK